MVGREQEDGGCSSVGVTKESGLTEGVRDERKMDERSIILICEVIIIR